MDIHIPSLEAVIKKFEDCYARISELYRDAPIAALTKPALANGWSVKDVLAHLAAWNWRCIFLLDAARETDWPLKADPDVEGLTREFQQERRNWSWVEVITDFREAHQTLIQTIRQLSPERWENPLVRRTILEEALRHYLDHMPSLEFWHKQAMISPVEPV